MGFGGLSGGRGAAAAVAMIGPDPTPPPVVRPREVRRIGDLDIVVAGVAEAVAEIRTAVVEHGTGIFGFCNAHTVNVARAQPAFTAAIRAGTLFNDGIGVDLASLLLYGARFPANLNGTDMTPAVLAALPAGTSVFLLGSPPGVAEVAAEVLTARYPQLRIVGTADGFFEEADEPALAARIRATGARLVLAGMGHPRQELWAMRNREAVGAVILCIGAFLDFTAGRMPRAPQWMRDLRAEWVYRLLREPRRMARRYLVGNLAFLLRMARQRRR